MIFILTLLYIHTFIFLYGLTVNKHYVNSRISWRQGLGEFPIFPTRQQRKQLIRNIASHFHTIYLLFPLTALIFI